MAQIDTSIYGNFQSPKINSPFENAAMVAQLQQARDQNRLAQMKFAEAERADTERNMLAGAYRDSYNEDGTQDRNKLFKALATGGHGQLVPGLQKQYNEADSSGVELSNKRLTGQKLQGEITQAQRERSAAKLGSFLNDPNLTSDKILADLQSQVQSGEVSLEQAKAMAQRIPQDPAQLKPFLNQILMSVMNPKEQVDANRNERNGLILPDGSINPALLDAKTKIAQSGASSIQNFGSPVSAIDPATGKPVLIQTGNRGGVNVLPYAPAPKEAKPFTESENNAAGYLGRMQAAEKTIGTLQGGELTVATALAGAVPFVGDYAQRKAMNPTQQKYKQAADDWIRAKLRKESGAVIGADEMKAEYRTYFPQPGDGAEVIAQKAQARKQAEAQIMQSAGRAGEAMQAKDDARYTERPFSKSEMDYIAAQKARGVSEGEIIRALNAANTKKPAPAKTAGGVKFLGFE